MQLDQATVQNRSNLGSQLLDWAGRATSIANEAVDVAEELSKSLKTLAYAPFGWSVKGSGNRKNNIINISSKEEINKYISFDGEGVITDGIYVAHPANPYLLLSSENFHRLLEREQISEIIRFARSELRVKMIRIAHQKVQSTAKTSGISLRGMMSALPTGVTAQAEQEQSMLAYFAYEEPTLVPLEGDLLWKNTYQELVSGLMGTTGGGAAKFCLQQNGLYQMSGEAGSILKMQTSYLNNRTLEVEINYV